MITASMIFASSLTAAVWIVLWIRTRHKQRKRLKSMDLCECTLAVERAEKTHDSVTRELAKMDSRDPDAPQSTEPKTELEQKRLGASTVAGVVFLGMLLTAFIAGGSVRERTSPAGRVDVPYLSIIGSKDTLQHQADFDEAVNTAGGQPVCVGGQSLGPGDTISQAVDVAATTTAKLEALVKAKPSLKIAIPKKP